MIIPGAELGIRHLIPTYIFVLAVIFSIQYVVEMVSDRFDSSFLGSLLALDPPVLGIG